MNSSRIQLKSTLRLHTNKVERNFINPVNAGNPSESSATVTVLSRKGVTYLVTNAHAVVDATFMTVNTNESSKKIPVQTVWFDAAVDLALLKIEHEADQVYLDKYLKPLILHNEFMPSNTEVSAYGYPRGGSSISVTSGQVSRTEILNCAFTVQRNTIVQTSTAINPGNSGGPVILSAKNKTLSEEEKNAMEEKCVGIVSSGLSNANNIGYYIPSPIVDSVIDNYLRFGHLRKANMLECVSLPEVHFKWQPLGNPVMREALGLSHSAQSNEEGGIYITEVDNYSSAYGLLQEGDVLNKIDGYQIQSDGKVKVAEIDNTILFPYLFQRKKMFVDTVTFEVLRQVEGKLSPVEIPVKLSRQLGETFMSWTDLKPVKYHVLPAGKEGGYVFVVVNAYYMRAYTQSYDAGSKKIEDSSGQPRMFKSFYSLKKSQELTQIIILDSIFKSHETLGTDQLDANAQNNCLSDRVVKVNGISIVNMNTLIEALENNKNKTHLIEFANGYKLFVPVQSQKQEEESKNFLKNRYRVAHFTSPSLATREGVDNLKKELAEEMKARFKLGIKFGCLS